MHNSERHEQPIAGGDDRHRASGPHDRRGTPRRTQGNSMNTIDRIFRGLGRFVFGLGVGLALTSAVVIVANGPAIEARDVRPDDVVRLDPVIVTISAERFNAERAGEPLDATVAVRPFEVRHVDG